MIINKHTSRPSKQSFQQILTKSYDNNLPNKRSSATRKTSSSMKKIIKKTSRPHKPVDNNKILKINRRLCRARARTSGGGKEMQKL